MEMKEAATALNCAFVQIRRCQNTPAWNSPTARAEKHALLQEAAARAKKLYGVIALSGYAVNPDRLDAFIAKGNEVTAKYHDAYSAAFNHYSASECIEVANKARAEMLEFWMQQEYAGYAEYMALTAC